MAFQGSAEGEIRQDAFKGQDWKQFMSTYLPPLARTLSHGPKLPARDDGKCGLMCALEEDGVVRVLLCLCHLSTGFSEGDANVLRGRGDTVSVSSMPGQDNVQLT